MRNRLRSMCLMCLHDSITDRNAGLKWPSPVTPLRLLHLSPFAFFIGSNGVIASCAEVGVVKKGTASSFRCRWSVSRRLLRRLSQRSVWRLRVWWRANCYDPNSAIGDHHFPAQPLNFNTAEDPGDTLFVIQGPEHSRWRSLGTA